MINKSVNLSERKARNVLSFHLGPNELISLIRAQRQPQQTTLQQRVCKSVCETMIFFSSRMHLELTIVDSIPQKLTGCQSVTISVRLWPHDSASRGKAL